MAYGGAVKTGSFRMFDPNDGKSSRVPLADNDPCRSTYSYAVGDLAVQAGATDVCVLEFPALAPAGRLIRLRQIQLSGRAGTSNYYVLNVLRRSTLNTGGTFSNPAGVPRDTKLDPSFASLKFYTANASALGTLVGPIDGGRLTLASSGGNNLDRLNLQYSWLNDMAPVLRNPGECFALNIAGLPAGCFLDISITWGEEEA